MFNHVEAMSRWADASSVTHRSMGQRRAPCYLRALSLDLQRNESTRWLPKFRNRQR